MPKRVREKNQYISRNLQTVRNFSRVTQEQIAEYLYISRTTYTKWETNVAQPSYNDLGKIIQFYRERNIDINYDMILSGEIIVSDNKIQLT